jgi:monovalent cation:H+ antiporter-2, CPA2 family
MPHDIALIPTIAASLGLALVFGLLAERLRLPALVGYLLAGVLIGPATPGFVADQALSAELAEIGVMLLMFGVGLHFSLADLLAVRRIALPGALVQMAAATVLSAGVAWLWGWDLGAGLVFGLALSVASTVVLLRALEQRGLLQTVNGQIAVGWLVVEDLAMVLVLVLLPALAESLGGSAPVADTAARTDWGLAARLDWGLAGTLLVTLAEISAFVALMLLAGRRVLPWLLWQVAATGSRELFVLCVAAAAVGIAYGASELFGVSFALGAFFAGTVLRESPLSHRAADESLPLRDAFSVLFFVSVGMLFDPMTLVDRPFEVLAVVGIVLLGKSLAAFLLVIAFRYPLNTALTVAASLAQIGEFSFILAGLGVALGILPEDGRDLILAGALISITVNPLLLKLVAPVEGWLRARIVLSRVFKRSPDPLAELPESVQSRTVTGHVVVVGHGRVGARLAQALTRARIAHVVVEENRERVERLRELGVHAVAGDAADPGVMIQAHAARAALLAIAVPDAARARRMIEIARMLNPRIGVVVRTHSDEESGLLGSEPGVRVFLGEHELADSMARYVVGQVGGEGH